MPVSWTVAFSLAPMPEATAALGWTAGTGALAAPVALATTATAVVALPVWTAGFSIDPVAAAPSGVMIDSAHAKADVVPVAVAAPALGWTAGAGALAVPVA